MRSQLKCMIAAALLPGMLQFASAADEITVKGREIFEKYKGAVVTVQLVMKSKVSVRGAGGDANEAKEEVTGTVIDPSGLTVLSLTATDPAGMMRSMMEDLSPDLKEFGLKVESSLESVKILLPDGTEIPSEVVLRDKDLDLAFVRPVKKPEKSMAAVDLKDAAPVQVLDQVITLNRLGRVSQRAHAASVERINAVVQKPRTFYISGSEMTATTLGSPAFTLDGKLAGIFVMRTVKGGGSGGMSMLRGQPDNIASIILPPGDILETAKQVSQKDEKSATKTP